MKRSSFPFIVTLLMLFFLYLPIVILVVNSFNESRFGGVWTGFSLKWYHKLFQDRTIWYALQNSLIVAVSASVTSTILGTLAAFSLHRYRTKLQKIHYGLIYAPLLIPDILMGICLLLFFIALNIQLSLFTIFLAHTTFCISYVTMVVLAKLHNFDFSLVEAAQDLGASGYTVMKRILLPLLMPGLISAFLLSFTLSIDDYIITSFVAGPSSTTLPLYVYGMIKYGSPPIINALSTLLLVVTFICVSITYRLTKEDAQ